MVLFGRDPELRMGKNVEGRTEIGRDSIDEFCNNILIFLPSKLDNFKFKSSYFIQDF